MKVELLKTFLEVSRTLHFRQAAESLYITQSAVSARIKLLEDDLGVMLFDRSQKHLKLTPEGHRLIKHATELLLMWQKTKQDVGVAKNASSQLVVGAISSIWDVILQSWLQKIHRNLDDLSLMTSNYSPIDLRKNLLNRLIDIAFLYEPPFVEEIITEKVAAVPLVLVSTEKEVPDTLFNMDNYVMVDYGEAINAQHLREFSAAPPPKHMMSQPKIALNFILEAGGSAYLPRQMTFQAVQANKLHIIESAPIYSREIFAAYLAKSQKVNIVQQVLNLFPQLKL